MWLNKNVTIINIKSGHLKFELQPNEQGKFSNLIQKRKLFSSSKLNRASNSIPPLSKWFAFEIWFHKLTIFNCHNFIISLKSTIT